MPITMTVPADEELLYQALFHPNQKIEPFGVVLTSKAAYLLRKKLFAVEDPWHYVRVPLEEVRGVSVTQPSLLSLSILSAALVTFGSYLVWAMFENIQKGYSTPISHYVFLPLMVGLVIPFVMRGRWKLAVTTNQGTFRWICPILVVGEARKTANGLALGFAHACRSLGIYVQQSPAT